MAIGDPWLLVKTSATYVSDTLGTSFRHKVNSIEYGQGGLGWTAGSATYPATFPKGLRPRLWIMKDDSTPPVFRRVIVATPTAYAAGLIGTTTLLLERDATQQTFTIDSKEGERHRGHPSI